MRETGSAPVLCFTHHSSRTPHASRPPPPTSLLLRLQLPNPHALHADAVAVAAAEAGLEAERLGAGVEALQHRPAVERGVGGAGVEAEEQGLELPGDVGADVLLALVVLGGDVDLVG